MGALYTTHTLVKTKAAKIDILFMTKAAEKQIPFRAAHTYIAHVREYPSRRERLRYV